MNEPAWSFLLYLTGHREQAYLFGSVCFTIKCFFLSRSRANDWSQRSHLKGRRPVYNLILTDILKQSIYYKTTICVYQRTINLLSNNLLFYFSIYHLSILFWSIYQSYIHYQTIQISNKYHSTFHPSSNNYTSI